jgi:hypothetical protein
MGYLLARFPAGTLAFAVVTAAYGAALGLISASAAMSRGLARGGTKSSHAVAFLTGFSFA